MLVYRVKPGTPFVSFHSPSCVPVVRAECRFLVAAHVGGESRERKGVGVSQTLRSDFFREEYALDYRLAKIAKEQVRFRPTCMRNDKTSLYIYCR